MKARLSGYLLIAGDPPEWKHPDEWQPEDPEDFAVTLDFHACPEGKNTADAFTVRICSPKWFFREFPGPVVSAERTLFMQRYDLPAAIKYLSDRCAATEGDSWIELAVWLHEIGQWEFIYKLVPQGPEPQT